MSKHLLGPGICEESGPYAEMSALGIVLVEQLSRWHERLLFLLMLLLRILLVESCMGLSVSRKQSKVHTSLTRQEGLQHLIYVLGDSLANGLEL